MLGFSQHMPAHGALAASTFVCAVAWKTLPGSTRALTARRRSRLAAPPTLSAASAYDSPLTGATKCKAGRGGGGDGQVMLQQERGSEGAC